VKYCFDMDETICLTPSSRKYEEAMPYLQVIKKINELYDSGHEISIFTSRGGTSGKYYGKLSLAQLDAWGVKYHKFRLGKPSYDLFVDDKAVSAKQWRANNGIKIVGFVASAFDLLHAGHCEYLKEAKSVCDYLVAALHEDPHCERSWKNSPVQTIIEREIQLSSIKYIDEIIKYKTEADLERILSKIRPDVRVVGDPGPVTGEQYCSHVYFHKRGIWSSTDLRDRIKNAQ